MVQAEETRERRYLSSLHYGAADLLAKEASAIEQQPQHSGQDIERLFVFVVGGVTAAVSFLEARINEFFADLEERAGTDVSKLDSATIEVLSRLWTQNGWSSELFRRARLTTLEKYQLALSLFSKPQFDQSAYPYQDVQALIELRNALVHYEPEWVVVDPVPTRQKDLERLEQVLRGRFELNTLPFVSTFLPGRCLSAGCARWAARSSHDFVMRFLGSMGLKQALQVMSAEHRYP